MIIDQDYWNCYYAGKEVPETHSPFAEWVVPQWDNKNSVILDVGCGNGRDLKYFRSLGYNVIGIDSVAQPLNNYYHTDLVRIHLRADIIYCRWVLHSLDERSQNMFLSNSFHNLSKNGKMYIECRSNKDNVPPKIDKHFRRPIDIIELEKEVKNIGYTIEYSKESRGWSTVGDDDPLLIRMILKK